MNSTTLQERLQAMRKSRGYSQEQLADLVGVSRQAVSKWESGSSLPDIDNLVRLSELYGESLDSIVKGKIADGAAATTDHATTAGETVIQLDPVTSHLITMRLSTWHYEYKSKATLWGLPLLHVNMGRRNGRLAVAKGIVAVGSIAVGLLSVGVFSLGLLSIGVLALGLLTLCFVGFGLLASAGIMAVGFVSFGVISVGYWATGVTAIGTYASGVAAMADKVAVGVAAVADVAIAAAVEGENPARGAHTLLIDSSVTIEQVREFIQAYAPETPTIIRDALVWVSTVL